MKGPWSVTSQFIDSERIFQVYRLRDVDTVDHAGNREYEQEIFLSRTAAERHAHTMNATE